MKWKQCVYLVWKKGDSIPTEIKVCTLIPCNQVEVSLINHGRSPFPCYSVKGNKPLFNLAGTKLSSLAVAGVFVWFLITDSTMLPTCLLKWLNASALQYSIGYAKHRGSFFDTIYTIKILHPWIMHHYDTASSHELCIHVLASLSPCYMQVCRLNSIMEGHIWQL